jgi:phosphopantothenoylcysteine decarboxylase
MANILLGVTGSVAALKTPQLAAALLRAGHAVKVVATTHSRYFFRAEDLHPVPLMTDEDEWPRLAEGNRYLRDDPVLHIELRRWADLFMIAPLDANTLAKLAAGLCDNCLTCVWRAWETTRPAILAPAMNTLMWHHPLTRRHFLQLIELANQPPPPADYGLAETLDWLNARCGGLLTIVGPIEKTLACGDEGLGAMAEVDDLVAAAARVLAVTP